MPAVRRLAAAGNASGRDLVSGLPGYFARDVPGQVEKGAAHMTAGWSPIPGR